MRRRPAQPIRGRRLSAVGGERYRDAVTGQHGQPAGSPASAAPLASADDVTRLLRASSAGDVDARDHLLAIVYEDLHAMARRRMRGERRDHTLGATALVSEAYLRLFRAGAEGAGDGAADGTGPAVPWADRAAFFAAAATTMRRVLVDHARARMASKRGGGGEVRGGAASPADASPDGTAAPARWRRVPLDALEAASSVDAAQVLELDEAMDALAAIDPRAAEVVRLRFFAGLELQEIGALLGVSDRTCKRDWAFARAWLHEALGIDGDDAADGASAAGDRPGAPA